MKKFTKTLTTLLLAGFIITPPAVNANSTSETLETFKVHTLTNTAKEFRDFEARRGGGGSRRVAPARRVAPPANRNNNNTNRNSNNTNNNNRSTNNTNNANNSNGPARNFAPRPSVQMSGLNGSRFNNLFMGMALGALAYHMFNPTVARAQESCVISEADGAQICGNLYNEPNGTVVTATSSTGPAEVQYKANDVTVYASKDVTITEINQVLASLGLNAKVEPTTNLTMLPA
ncbi:hypothetical protein CKF54_07375 [Psittacicella hinzii]|uniref:Uncharacterized protein n=1 Tax=Psittacicella hinzii TaxID=2028575 RepID=A0A3A1Y1Q7_9GAMM|nr:hypothetical protein [Psittacicella hinzii]RIY31158.1 hypothetical protein CKF54_07375 [Psittacicella hinzii]